MIDGCCYRKSYELGQAQQFNAQLNATNKKFTYFIPSNKAWQTARVMMPSAIKKLFMQDFSYHVSFKPVKTLKMFTDFLVAGIYHPAAPPGYIGRCLHHGADQATHQSKRTEPN